ncbi:MAG: response regulator, partial [Saprospiraceae bacterium]|nr:response regulator [Saprospiraceae bacterium]
HTDQPVVLLVDDHQDVLEYLQICVSSQYQVLTASDGEEALSLAIEQIPDLIVSDIMMERMNGYQLLEELKGNIITNHIPVILLTAKTSQEERQLGIKMGADAYLCKPFDQKELLLRIQNLLQLLENNKLKFQHPRLAVSSQLSSSRDLFLDQLESFVREHILEDFGVEDVAYHFSVSRVQLYRKVKATTGKSVSAYIRLIRLYEGRKLLRTTPRNISEIAFEVGFKDPNYFSRTFQEEFGRSPSDFRLKVAD